MAEISEHIVDSYMDLLETRRGALILWESEPTPQWTWQRSARNTNPGVLARSMNEALELYAARKDDPDFAATFRPQALARCAESLLQGRLHAIDWTLDDEATVMHARILAQLYIMSREGQHGGPEAGHTLSLPADSEIAGKLVSYQRTCSKAQQDADRHHYLFTSDYMRDVVSRWVELHE